MRMVELQLTDEERKAIVAELAERMRDLVYMNAEKKAEEALDRILKQAPTPDTVISVTYEVRFVFGDVLQILGRLRRREEERRVQSATKPQGL